MRALVRHGGRSEVSQLETVDGVNEKKPIPTFAQNFPPDPALDVLVKAFVDGDYATIRRDAITLIANTKSEEVRDATELLRSRVETDPMAKAMIVVTAAVLMILTLWWIFHDEPPADVPSNRAPMIERVR